MGVPSSSPAITPNCTGPSREMLVDCAPSVGASSPGRAPGSGVTFKSGDCDDGVPDEPQLASNSAAIAKIKSTVARPRIPHPLKSTWR